MTRSIALACSRQERLFVLALLLALASALIPALFPAGSAMDQRAGSAFDPTTSSVSLRVREAVPAPAAILTEPEGDRTQAPQSLFVLPAGHPSALSRAILLETGTQPLPRPAPQPEALNATQARPRAPPARPL